MIEIYVSDYIAYKEIVELNGLKHFIRNVMGVDKLFALDDTVTYKHDLNSKDKDDFEATLANSANKRVGSTRGVYPFASKKLENDSSLFKRVHGVPSVDIPAGLTGYVNLIIPYNACKFSGAEIINVELGDTLDFFVLDTPTNTYSSLPVETYGANFPLNQFGFNVVMPNSEQYKNTSNYDADLFLGMEIMCAYKNNSDTAKKVYMNVDLHEVK